MADIENKELLDSENETDTDTETIVTGKQIGRAHV